MGGPGSVLVNGVGALLNLNGSPLAVGGTDNSDGGNGALTISGGGTVDAGEPDETGNSALALGKSGAGAITVTDAGSSLNIAGFAHIGRGGFGTLSVQNSAVATFALDATNNGGLAIGVGSGSSGNPTGGTGEASVTSHGTLISDANLGVGGAGVTGILNVSSAVVTAQRQMTVGSGNTIYGAGSGTVNIGAAGRSISTGPTSRPPVLRRCKWPAMRDRRRR